MQCTKYWKVFGSALLNREKNLKYNENKHFGWLKPQVNSVITLEVSKCCWTPVLVSDLQESLWASGCSWRFRLETTYRFVAHGADAADLQPFQKTSVKGIETEMVILEPFAQDERHLSHFVHYLKTDLDLLQLDLKI